jgi:nitroreductase
MEGIMMLPTLNAISHRRAVKCFDRVDIPTEIREQLLNAARSAPSSFNTQPYRLYWVQSDAQRAAVARLCLGQSPAETASVLVVVVADIGSLRATSALQVEWMRKTGCCEKKIRDYVMTAKLGRLIFAPGPLGVFGACKWLAFRLLNLWKIVGRPPVFRKDVFKWATKSTSLACQNLMIAAEAVGLNSCPMEGFDARRLSKFLGLSPRVHDIVMVIAIGKKAQSYVDQPQWRRPLESTVTLL